MKSKIIFLSIISSLIITCNTGDDTFWERIKAQIEKNKEVKIIKIINDSTIMIGGKIHKQGQLGIKLGQGFVDISFDIGKNWEKFPLDCHTVTQIESNGTTIIVTGIKYIDDTHIRTNHFRYNPNSKNLMQLELPGGVEGNLVGIKDDTTYFFDVTENQFGNTYLKTIDGGKTWSKHLILMKDKKDQFHQYCILGDKIWGVKTANTINEKTIGYLISIDINSWKIIDEIPLGKYLIDKKGYPISTHWVSDIGTNKKKLYVLGKNQVNNIGYIWQISDTEDTLSIVREFPLKENQIPDRIFSHKDIFLVTVAELSNFTTSYSLLLNSGELKWTEIAFPSPISPIISVHNGKLLGITVDNNIYFKQF